MSLSSVSLLRQSLQTALKKHANTAKAAGKQKYFKNVIQFHGLDTPVLQSSVFTPIFNESIKKIPLPEQVDLACELLTSKYAEEKYCGIMLLSKNVKNIAKFVAADQKLKKKKEEDEDDVTFTEAVLTKLETHIDDHVYDWGTCDVLSSKVICELIKLNPTLVAPLVQQWKSSPKLWRQRAACVSFVKIARHGQHNQTIINICETCVQNQERFVQLGCGWVLRELSLSDLKLVVQFITEHYDSFIREGLRYAIEKMEPQLRSQLLAYKTGDEIKLDQSSQKKKSKGLSVRKKRAVESDDESEESEESSDDKDHQPAEKRNARITRSQSKKLRSS